MNRIMLLFAHIANDMMEPVGYLPWGLLAGCIFLLVMYVKQRFFDKTSKKKKNTFKLNVFFFLTIIYVVTLLKLAFFSREPGSRTGVSLKLFETWGSTMQSHAFFVENILMFIPFGILVPLLSARFRNFFRCAGAAFLCSLALEIMQLITGRGFCQLDDIVTNTIGGMIGFIVYCIWQSVRYANYD